MARLYLIPNFISENDEESQISSEVKKIIENTGVFIVENIRNARRFIRKLSKEKNIDDITFYELNKHTSTDEIPSFLKPLKEGKDVGLISEAGVPCVADPGSVIVSMAQDMNIEVVPLVGPSSILLALMASGLNGQQFNFHGYLPIPKEERLKKLRSLDKIVHAEGHTQIFIETPYRNNQLLKDMMQVCHQKTKICLGTDIFGKDGFIKTKTVLEWKKCIPELHKKTVVFLMGL